MLPQETLCDILANLCRRDFDVLELINRALVSLISAKFNDALRRVISLMFYEEGLVMATCPSDGWRRLPIVELPRYLPRSVITKVNIKSGSDHALNEEMYQGENQWVGKRECDQGDCPTNIFVGSTGFECPLKTERSNNGCKWLDIPDALGPNAKGPGISSLLLKLTWQQIFFREL